jgi:hypothetical protein
MRERGETRDEQGPLDQCDARERVAQRGERSTTVSPLKSRATSARSPFRFTSPRSISPVWSAAAATGSFARRRRDLVRVPTEWTCPVERLDDDDRGAEVLLERRGPCRS